MIVQRREAPLAMSGGHGGTIIFAPSELRRIGFGSKSQLQPAIILWSPGSWAETLSSV
jgi:hypothetical protein